MPCAMEAGEVMETGGRWHESSHAIAQALKLARELPKDALVLCNLSGRGDKDVHTIAAREGISL